MQKEASLAHITQAEGEAVKEFDVAVGRIEDLLRKLAEQNLRIHQRAMKQSSNGILICDAGTDDLPLAYVNPAFERITGYSAEEVVGLSPSVFCHSDSAVRKFGAQRASQSTSYALFWYDCTRPGIEFGSLYFFKNGKLV